MVSALGLGEDDEGGDVDKVFGVSAIVTPSLLPPVAVEDRPTKPTARADGRRRNVAHGTVNAPLPSKQQHAATSSSTMDDSSDRWRLGMIEGFGWLLSLLQDQDLAMVRTRKFVSVEKRTTTSPIRRQPRRIFRRIFKLARAKCDRLLFTIDGSKSVAALHAGCFFLPPPQHGKHNPTAPEDGSS
jgi:hypothetical protein